MPKWTHVVIHHTAGQDNQSKGDIEAIREYHVGKKGWLDIGYHFVVERVFGSPTGYNVFMGRPLHMDGAHAGLTEWNKKGIGVALVGDFSKAPPSPHQVDAAARLVRGLCVALDIPIDREHIVGHGEFRTTECPGKYFNLDYFVDRVRAV